MKIKILFVLFLFTIGAAAQQKSSNRKVPLVFSAGVGVGKSPIFEDDRKGISGMVDFGLWRKKSQVLLAYHSTGEFQILGSTFPNKTSTSLDLNYGRVLIDRKIKVISNIGLGVVKSVVPGQYQYSDPGWFGSSYYEKLRFYTVGLPISTKVILMGDNKFGIGLEGYVNINKYYTFYMLNLIIVAKNK